MYNSTQLFDVRMLVLKRWNQAQTGDLFDKAFGQRGQYISFQSYHFIDIFSSTKHPTLLRTYEQLRDTKNISAESAESPVGNGFYRDIHTVQNMMLLGESNGFWEDSAGIMNITFIQLVDSTSWTYDKIKEQIARKTATSTGDQNQENWALYYSLDFCDLVLFTKHLKMKLLHDLLWDMTQSKSIRDTFTINCFEYAFLGKFFEEERQGIRHASSLTWDDELALSMNFSVRDMSVLPTLLKSISKALKTEDIVQSNHNKTKQFRENRLPGRYDLRITTDMLNGDIALRLLYQVNSLFNSRNGKAKKPFYDYEIVLLIAPENRDISRRNTRSSPAKFEKKVGIILKTLYDVCISIKQPFMDYTLETLRALNDLNRSGFSEEFVLSVLPSFSAFIKIAEQATTFQAETQEDSEHNNIENSLLQMQKNYFSALNTLSLCTMHSERQFIHSPAFNASYFEIPPKMLAFYSAITDHIASLLTECADKKYNYLIAPDFRSDIYVKPLNIHYKKDTTRHLAIINLPEKYFYQPERAIMLLAHEVGHYEGNREREKRAKCIFEMVGLLLLRHTMLNSANQKTIPQIAWSFAEEFGNFLFNEYTVREKKCVREIQAALDSVAHFLGYTNYGLDYFSSIVTAETLTQRWAKKLYDKRKDEVVRQECTSLLEMLDSHVHTDYLVNLVDESAFMNACDVISRHVVNQLYNLAQPNMRKVYSDIPSTGEAIVQAFSEAFADIQMLHVMGDQFNPEDYVSLLKDMQKDIGIPSTEQLLRYNAMQRIKQNLPEAESFTIYDDSFLNAVVKSIVSYLRFAGEHQAKKTNTWCTRKWEQEYLGETDWMVRCRIVCDMLAAYKDTQFFKQA